MWEVKRFRYQEAFHLSEREINETSLEAIERASIIWELDAERANVKT